MLCNFESIVLVSCTSLFRVASRLKFVDGHRLAVLVDNTRKLLKYGRFDAGNLELQKESTHRNGMVLFPFYMTLLKFTIVRVGISLFASLILLSKVLCFMAALLRNTCILQSSKKESKILFLIEIVYH